MSEWISVGERLPEYSVDVLVAACTPLKPVWIACLNMGHMDDADFWVYPSGLRVRHVVSHWMPLPEPPK